MHVLVEILGGIPRVGTREHAHGEHRDAVTLQGLGLVHRGGGHRFAEAAAVVGLAVGEDDDHLLGILPGAHTGAIAAAVKDIFRQLQTEVHTGGAGGSQAVDRCLESLGTVAAHIRQVLDDLGVVVITPILQEIIADSAFETVVSELDDTDLMCYVIIRTGHFVAAHCVSRYLADEAVDGGLQGCNLLDAAHLVPGVQLAGPEGCILTSGSVAQPGAAVVVVLQPVLVVAVREISFSLIISCDLIVLVADLVVVGRAPPIRHIIIRPSLGTSGRIGVGLHVILHGAGYIQHQDDVQGGGGLGLGHLVGDVGLQAQLIAARVIGHFLVDDHAVRLRRYLAGTGPGVGCPCLDRQEAEHHHQRQNKG